MASSHAVFGHFAGEALDHQDRVLAAGDDQVEIALFQLVLRGEGDELAVDVAQADRAERALERQRRDAQARPRRRSWPARRRRSAGRWPARRLWTCTSSWNHVGKQRADGAVHQPGGERFLGRRAAFALEEAAGELAGRGRPLAIVAGQREEVGCRAAAGRRPRRPARRFRRTAPGSCRRPAWPDSRFRWKERLAPICFSTRTFNVISLPSLQFLSRHVLA